MKVLDRDLKKSEEIGLRNGIKEKDREKREWECV